MNILEELQKQEYRFEMGKCWLKEPDEAQIKKLKEMISNQVKFDEGLNASGFVGADTVRYILKELTSLGNCIDEYTDEELDNRLRNGARELVLLNQAVITLVTEIIQDMQFETSTSIKMLKQILEVTDSDIEAMQTEQAFLNLCESMGVSVNLGELQNISLEKNKLQQLLDDIKK